MKNERYIYAALYFGALLLLNLFAIRNGVFALWASGSDLGLFAAPVLAIAIVVGDIQLYKFGRKVFKL